MTQLESDAANADQVAFWNGPAGEQWAARQAAQDVVLGPVTALLLDAAAARPGERVIDVGCGCGATSLALAERVGPVGRVLGIDISQQMLARARQLAPSGAPVDFVLADATTYRFAPGAADLVASRFGVMFFADPPRSFANLRAGMRRGGRVVFVCWRAARENPWLMVPLQAVYRHVPKMPPVDPEDPGPFAFASAERVERILREAGFAGAKLTPHDLMLDIAAGGGLDAAVESAVEIGPAHRALEDATAEVKAAATEAVRHDLARHLDGDAVKLGAAVWIVTASAP